MTLQVAQLTEGLVTAGVTTLVRLVARVRADVLLEVRQLRELALADLAAVRFDAQVDTSVLRQVRAVRERLAALRTLVRLHLTHVQLRVQLQLRLGPKDLQQQTKYTLVLGYFKIATTSKLYHTIHPCPSIPAGFKRQIQRAIKKSPL